jgi:hypothetical protein
VVVAALRWSSQEFVAVAARFADGSPRQAGLRVRRRLAGLAAFAVKACVAASGLALWSQVVCSRCRCGWVSARPRRRRVARPRLACSRCGGCFGAVETPFRSRHTAVRVSRRFRGLGLWRRDLSHRRSPNTLVRLRSTCCLAVATSLEGVGQLDTGSFPHCVSNGRTRVRPRLPPLRPEVRFGPGGWIQWRRGSVAATKRDGVGESNPLAVTSVGRLERRYGNGLDSITCRGAPAKAHCRLRPRASSTQGGWELVSARARPRASAEHSRRCRALWVLASSVATRVTAAGPLDPGRRDRVETPAPGVLVMVVLWSGSARSPHRREAGLSTVCIVTSHGGRQRPTDPRVQRRKSPAGGVLLA